MQGDNIAELDFRDTDGSDPLGADDFFKTKASWYKNNDLCSIFVILYKNKLARLLEICW